MFSCSKGRTVSPIKGPLEGQVEMDRLLVGSQLGSAIMGVQLVRRVGSLFRDETKVIAVLCPRRGGRGGTILDQRAETPPPSQNPMHHRAKRAVLREQQSPMTPHLTSRRTPAQSVLTPFTSGMSGPLKVPLALRTIFSSLPWTEQVQSSP